MGYSRKNPNMGVWGHIFLRKTTLKFLSLHFTLGNSGKTKLYPSKFFEIVLHPLEIPLLFQLNPGISTWHFSNISESSMFHVLYKMSYLSIYLSILYIYICVCVCICIYKIYIYIYPKYILYIYISENSRWQWELCI